MLREQTLFALFDELEKIADGAVEAMPIQSAGPSDLVVTSTTDPLNSWEKNPSWEQTPPRRNANALFGGKKKTDGALRAKYDQGSSAATSPDRSQYPVDGQSTANIAAGNTISPASGPGGV